MTDEPKDKKSTLINELDSLRYTLNSGPEFQHNIPTLDELYADDDSFMHDPALNVPILTDALEDEPAFIQKVATKAEDSALMIEKQRAMTEGLGIFDRGHPSPSLSAPPEIAAPTTQADEQDAININALCKETDSSVIELEHVLDELVAEQLPKLEQQLREKLRHELETGLATQAKSNKPTSDN
tara:strand:- start:23719 stop:24270 length:552 start_codon:yes stop_codon:yes gene_type:complete